MMSKASFSSAELGVLVPRMRGDLQVALTTHQHSYAQFGIVVNLTASLTLAVGDLLIQSHLIL